MTLAREAWRPAGEFGEQPVDDLPDKEHDKRNWPCPRHPPSRASNTTKQPARIGGGLNNGRGGTENRAAVAAQLPSSQRMGQLRYRKKHNYGAPSVGAPTQYEINSIGSLQSVDIPV